MKNQDVKSNTLEQSNIRVDKSKNKDYVDNEKFYDSLVEYKRITDISRVIHNTALNAWKLECSIILKHMRIESPHLYREFITDKFIRERKRGKWPRDITTFYGLPKEPVFVAPRIPEYIGKCIYLIAKGLSTYWKFCSYTYRDEMAADGIEDAILRVHSFDPEKSKNPFAYFTQICYFAAIRRIKKEKKQKLVKSEIVKNSGIIDTLSGSNQQDSDDTEYHNNFLSFLLENVDNNTSTDEEKEVTISRDKKTTKAHMKRKQLAAEREIELQTDGIDAVDPDIEETDIINEYLIDFGMEDSIIINTVDDEGEEDLF